MSGRSDGSSRLLSHDAAFAFLNERVNYERWLAMPYGRQRLRLRRMRQLLRRLGDPHLGMAFIHVAGTKGKGSVAAMMASVLNASGRNVGLFTSPHLQRIEERIALGGVPCSTDEFADLVGQVRPAVEAIDAAARAAGDEEGGPTYFEILTAMAMVHFAARRADAAVLEVGLGGRLDSTNVCRPCVSVITSISFDHMRQLGNTLAAIGAEKAGIIKRGVPVVSGVASGPAEEVIRAVARQRQAPLAELGRDYQFDYQPPRHLEAGPAWGRLQFQSVLAGKKRRYHDLALSLPGRHQAANAAVALAALEILRQAGWDLDDEQIRSGLANLRWPARVEVVARRPTVVIDAAHNVASIEALLAALDESFVARRRLLLFATTEDKDARGMLERLLGRFDTVILTRYGNSPRGVPAERLGVLARELCGRDLPVIADLGEAWRTLSRQAGQDDLLCATGSFFLAAEVRLLATATGPSPPSRM